MEALDWFWPDHFALGKLGVIGGLPDRGKGLITAYLMARATTGAAWPCGEGHAPSGNVILFTGEDAEKDTVIPRLAAAGADRTRIHIIRGIKDHKTKKQRMFSLLSDLEALERKIQEIGDIVLVIIDPMSAYFGVGKMDSYRTSDVRGILTPLKELAERQHCAIIAVMHFNKKTGNNAMLRISDSLAFVAAPRHVYVVVDQPDTPEIRLFTKAKNNAIRNTAQTLTYTTEAKQVGVDPRTGELIEAPFIVWGGYVDISADEALAETEGSDDTRHQARTDAEGFLKEFLGDGEFKTTEEILNAASRAGHSKRTIWRAADNLPITKKSTGKGAGKMWALAPHNPQ